MDAQPTRRVDLSPFFVEQPLLPSTLAEVYTRWSELHDIGGIASFTGQVRADRHQNGTVRGIEFTAQREMATTAAKSFVDRTLAAASGEPMAIYMRHRLGLVASGEWPVLIVVGSAHRDTAFTVCRTLIDSLKAECPIFGKEQLSGGGHRWKEA